jgi:hypothetical protein
MRMRNRFTAISLAAFIALAVVACTNGSNSDGSNGVLNVSSATPTQPSASDASAHNAGPRPAGLLSFPFPGNVHVEFQTPLPASGVRRDAMIGYENYVDSGWYAVYTHGASKTYAKYVFGNALTDFNELVKELTGYRLRGTIVYSDISVPQVFHGAGAVVQACVDDSGLYVANAKTGRLIETVFRGNYDQYQEQVSAGKSGAGFWFVNSTELTPGVCS